MNIQNKNNAQNLYDMILTDDEALAGIQWEEMYCSEYDTPSSIINNFIEIFLETDFATYDGEDYVSVANYYERRIALVKYFEYIIQEMKSNENNLCFEGTDREVQEQE